MVRTLGLLGGTVGSAGACASWEPTFARLVMLGPTELDGYRVWVDAGGGYLT